MIQPKMKILSEQHVRYICLCLFVMCLGYPALAHAGMIDRLNQTMVNYEAYSSLSLVCQGAAILLALLLRKTHSVKTLKAWSMRKSTRPTGFLAFSVAAGVVLIPYLDIAFVYLWFFSSFLLLGMYGIYAILAFCKKSISWKVLYWNLVLAFAQVFATAAYWFLCPAGFFKELFKYTDDGYVEGFFMYPERFLLSEVGILMIVVPAMLLAPFAARMACFWIARLIKRNKRVKQVQ